MKGGKHLSKTGTITLNKFKYFVNKKAFHYREKLSFCRGGRVKALSIPPCIPVFYILIPKTGHQLRHQRERFKLSS